MGSGMATFSRIRQQIRVLFARAKTDPSSERTRAIREMLETLEAQEVFRAWMEVKFGKVRLEALDEEGLNRAFKFVEAISNLKNSKPFSSIAELENQRAEK